MRAEDVSVVVSKEFLSFLAYVASISVLLMLVFADFRADMFASYDILRYGGSTGIKLNFINSKNAFPIVMGLCGLSSGFLLWWHHRPN